MAGTHESSLVANSSTCYSLPSQPQGFPCRHFKKGKHLTVSVNYYLQKSQYMRTIHTPTEHTWPGHTSLPLWQTAQPATHYPPNLKTFLVETSRKVRTLELTSI